jgi:hypothetical protein
MSQPPPSRPIDLPRAREVLAATEKGLREGDARLAGAAAAIRLEIAIAEAENAAGADAPMQGRDPLFRLRANRWAMVEGDLAALVPVRDLQLRMLTVDVSELVDGQTRAASPAASGLSHVIVRKAPRFRLPLPARGERVGVRRPLHESELVEAPPHPALRADLSPQAGRGRECDTALPHARVPRPRHVVAFAPVNGGRREPLFISDETARIVELSDGTRTALEIATEIATEIAAANQSEGVRRVLRRIEDLFVSGLLWLQEPRGPAAAPSPMWPQ